MLQREELIGPETVNTMPLETVVAFQDHGAVREDLDGGRREGAGTSDGLAGGVHYGDVVATLEREGVEKFSELFRQLLDGIEAKRAALVA